MIGRVADNAVEERHFTSSFTPKVIIGDTVEETPRDILQRGDKVCKKFGVDGTCAEAEERAFGYRDGHRGLAQDEDIFGDGHIPKALQGVGREVGLVEAFEACAINLVGDVERIKPRLSVDV